MSRPPNFAYLPNLPVFNGGEPGFGFLLRQASEQYFTSSQFLAQLFRQVISRPHVTQILLGRPALLPLNPECVAMLTACQFRVLL